MSLFRGIADDLKLQDWLEKFIFPAEAKNVTPDFVRWGTRLACLEMLLSGTTTFTDMYYFEDVVARSRQGSRHARRAGRNHHRLPSRRCQRRPPTRCASPRSSSQRFHNDPLIVPAVAPHAHLHQLTTRP